MMFRTPFAASVLMLLVSACAPLVMPGGEGRGPIVVTEQDDGKAVELAVGDVLSVELSAVPGTGFSWVPSMGTDTLLAQMDPAVNFRPKPQDASDRRVGGAETQVLRFQARKPGTADLVLDYRRPWESSNPQQQRFHLKLLVQ